MRHVLSPDVLPPAPHQLSKLVVIKHNQNDNKENTNSNQQSQSAIKEESQIGYDKLTVVSNAKKDDGNDSDSSEWSSGGEMPNRLMEPLDGPFKWIRYTTFKWKDEPKSVERKDKDSGSAYSDQKENEKAQQHSQIMNHCSYFKSALAQHVKRMNNLFFKHLSTT